MNKTIQIIINGSNEQCPGGASVADLLKSKSIDTARVVVEVNQVVIRRDMFDSHRLNDGDRIEILRFVGGG